MKNKMRKIAALLLMLLMVLITGCGGDTTESDVEPLGEVTELPEDGVISKAQFQTVAGEDKEIQFTGKNGDITYTWTFQAKMIQNPIEQKLSINFSTEGLDDIKKKANNAVNALKMSMSGEGLIAVPTLTVVLPEVWEADTGLLLKEQGGNLARMSDVSIETDKEKNTTTLTMNVTSLNGDCFVVGGVTELQNKGADNANENNDVNMENDNTEIRQEEEEVPQEEEQTEVEEEEPAEDIKTENKNATCTISISCSTILNNMNDLAKEKQEFVPADGLILAPSEVEIEEGESVHDVLKRVCLAAGIHMESTYTPLYDSAYVEGINQLYEFDCGEYSGWMYKVNGWFPNYGCSKYYVSDGDVIEWVFTCDLGKDVGDNSMY